MFLSQDDFDSDYGLMGPLMINMAFMRTDGRTVESSAVFCLSRIRNIVACDGRVDGRKSKALQEVPADLKMPVLYNCIYYIYFGQNMPWPKNISLTRLTILKTTFAVEAHEFLMKLFLVSMKMRNSQIYPVNQSS